MLCLKASLKVFIFQLALIVLKLITLLCRGDRVTRDNALLWSRVVLSILYALRPGWVSLRVVPSTLWERGFGRPKMAATMLREFQCSTERERWRAKGRDGGRTTVSESRPWFSVDDLTYSLPKGQRYLGEDFICVMTCKVSYMIMVATVTISAIS